MKKEQMFVEERRHGIQEYVIAHKKATVAELCEQFSVSSATVRNDLRDLEQNSLLIRTHGGAMVKEQTRFELDAKAKEVRHLEEKKAIAVLALNCIEDGDTIILDTGSTTQELAALLGARKDLTVLTNDLTIALMLEDHPTAIVHILGGMVRKRFHCTVGARAELAIEGLTVDKAFMGANSFSLEKGASTPDLQLAELKRRMLSIARKIFLLADSSKIGKDSFAGFAAPDSIDCLITDEMDVETINALDEIGIEVITASRVDSRLEDERE